MPTLRFLTAGESHGKALMGILEGVPSGFPISQEDIDGDLKRRQGGHGRGGRMKIESDRVEILSGVRWGRTTGAPITLLIENRDWKNWGTGMSVSVEHAGALAAVTRPRPGHADLAGVLKYGERDIRNILERSSARETAMRVALGALAKRILAEVGVLIGSYVVQIGSEASGIGTAVPEGKLLARFSEAERSPVRCPDKDASKKMISLIDKAQKEGNTLGGIFEVFAAGIPAGLGSHVHWDRKLDGRLAQAFMSIQAIKAVEIGLGFQMGKSLGSDVMDEIFYARGRRSKGTAGGFMRKTNFAGGIEGGISNGMPITIRAAMKPIPTLRKPLTSVDITSKRPFKAAYERSDVCAVPAAAIVGEAMCALVVADAFLEKFGGDSRDETLRNYRGYLSSLDDF